MKHRTALPFFLLSLAFILSALPLTALETQSETKKPPVVSQPKPNIVFLLCDDLGYGDVGVFFQNQRAALKDPSVPYFTTPQLDRMAGAGMMLTQHYAGAPVCASSRASLLTGRTQGHTSVRNNQFDKALADTHTLGSVLQQAGYATAAVGKWGLQGQVENPDYRKRKGKKQTSSNFGDGTFGDWEAYPTKRGFNDFFGYVRHRDGHFHYPKEDRREIWANDREVSEGLDLCYTTDLFTAWTKRWIIEQNRNSPEQPFFIYLAYDTPHAVLQNPPCEYPAGGGLNGGVQWTGQPHAMINTAKGKMDGWMHPEFANARWDHDGQASTSEKAWPEVQKRYANGVRRIDDSVGDLLQLLTDLGIAKNTLVIFTSDNGPSAESYLKGNPFKSNFFHGFGPFDGIKRDTLEGGLREPTIVQWPGQIAPASKSAEPSGHWDWLATFAEVAGLTPPAGSDGVSLLPILTGHGQRTGGILYSEYEVGGRVPGYPEFEASHRNAKRGQMQVIHLNGYKGLRYDVQSAKDDFAIYNLAKDPKEANNLALSPEYAELQAAMKARVLQVRKPDADAKRPYDNEPVPANTNAPKGASGLSCALYFGEWPWIPDFRTMKPSSIGQTTEIAALPKHGGRPYGLLLTGYFHAEETGLYQFTLESDTGAMLFLHDIRVIDEPKQNAGGTLSGKVRLEAGWHPIRVAYRNAGNAEAMLKLKAQSPSGAALEFDQSNLSL